MKYILSVLLIIGAIIGCQQATSDDPTHISDMYTLTVNICPANSCLVVVSPDDGSYMPGSTVCLSATPNPPYVFDRWEINNVIIRSTRTFIVVDLDTSATAYAAIPQ